MRAKSTVASVSTALVGSGPMVATCHTDTAVPAASMPALTASARRLPRARNAHTKKSVSQVLYVLMASAWNSISPLRVSQSRPIVASPPRLNPANSTTRARRGTNQMSRAPRRVRPATPSLIVWFAVLPANHNWPMLSKAMSTRMTP